MSVADRSTWPAVSERMSRFVSERKRFEGGLPSHSRAAMSGGPACFGRRGARLTPPRWGWKGPNPGSAQGSASEVEPRAARPGGLSCRLRLGPDHRAPVPLPVSISLISKWRSRIVPEPVLSFFDS